MGTVFVVVAGQHGSIAANFYRMFPAESVLPNQDILQIRHVVRVSNPSLDTLLQEISRRHDQEIVVVSHGNPEQLAIPVMPGVRVGLNIDFVDAILGPRSDQDLAEALHTNQRSVANLRAKIRAVQQLGLRRIEFRACQVGQSRPTLEALRRLFGAGTACGPRLFDGYGSISGTAPTTNAELLRRWQSNHLRHQIFGTSPNRFFWVNDGSADPPIISHVFAESWIGVREWIEAKFPSGSSHNFQQGTFYYHIQVAMLPDSRTVHGRRTFDSNFIFPNDTTYRQNLVQVQSSAAELPNTIPTSVPTIQGRGPIGQEVQYVNYEGIRRRPIMPLWQIQNHLPGPKRGHI